MDKKDLDRLKPYFIGPQSENGKWLLEEIQMIFQHHLEWRTSLFPNDGVAITDLDKKSAPYLMALDRMTSHIRDLMVLFERETPKFTPRYAGHMVSALTLPALLGHIVCLLHNPNLASTEVARIAALIEKEAVAFLLKMIGFSSQHGRGHFTSGGTVANFEALWRARYRLDHWLSLGALLKSQSQTPDRLFDLAHMGWKSFDTLSAKYQVKDETLRPWSFVLNGPWETKGKYDKAFNSDFKGPVVLVPGNKHYSWQKGVSLLGLGDTAFWSIPLDEKGRADVGELKKLIEKARNEDRPILMVVSVAGTTETGQVDPIDQTQDLLDQYARDGIEIWHHIDAAYGGFYTSLLDGPQRVENLEEPVERALRAISRSTSVTIDPHKLGYVPYACGAIMVRDEISNSVSSFPAPYLLKEKAGGAWSSTLEGSRAASGATATWLTARTIGLEPHGYGCILSVGLAARKELLKIIKDKAPIARVIEPSDLNVVCLCLAEEGEALSLSNERTGKTYQLLRESPNYGVSKTHLSMKDYGKIIEYSAKKWRGKIDTDHMTLLRVVLMNPFILSQDTKVNYLEGFVDEMNQLSQK